MKILLAYDGSKHSERALDRAIMIAVKTQAEVDVISVAVDLCLPEAELTVDQCREVTSAVEKETRKALDTAAGKFAASQLPLRTHFQTGDPADRILETAASIRADLIVIGSRGKSVAKEMFLGSVSRKVAEQATCDVLVVK